MLFGREPVIFMYLLPATMVACIDGWISFYPAVNCAAASGVSMVTIHLGNDACHNVTGQSKRLQYIYFTLIYVCFLLTNCVCLQIMNTKGKWFSHFESKCQVDHSQSRCTCIKGCGFNGLTQVSWAPFIILVEEIWQTMDIWCLKLWCNTTTIWFWYGFIPMYSKIFYWNIYFMSL